MGNGQNGILLCSAVISMVSSTGAWDPVSTWAELVSCSSCGWTTRCQNLLQICSDRIGMDSWAPLGHLVTTGRTVEVGSRKSVGCPAWIWEPVASSSGWGVSHWAPDFSTVRLPGFWFETTIFSDFDVLRPCRCCKADVDAVTGLFFFFFSPVMSWTVRFR